MTPTLLAELRRIDHELNRLTDTALKLHYDLERALRSEPNDLRAPRETLRMPKSQLDS